MPRTLRRLLALGLGSILAVGAFELALRALVPTPGFRVWRPGREHVFEPDPALLSGVAGPARFRISSLGFRARERPAEVELALLALGGSATECLYLDQDEAWPALLEARLNASSAGAWVANAGKSGRDARDHAVQLRHLLAQEPRFDRVVLLTGVNDLCGWLAADGRSPRDPAWELGRAFDVVPRAARGRSAWRRSATRELLETLGARLAAPVSAQDARGAIYAVWRAHRRGASAWRTRLSDPGVALATFRAALGECADVCARRGTGLVLVTQPALWRAGLPADVEARLWMGGVGPYQTAPGSEYYTSAAMAEGLALFNEALAGFARERALPLLDLAAEVGGDPELFYDDVHFNEAGARAVAAFLADGLVRLAVARPAAR